MKKFIPSFVSLLLLFVVTTNEAAASTAFQDVDENHPNFQAIEYLYENEVINGYPDGSFKPENKVNRAELLKILIEGNNIPLESSNLPFSDIEKDSWYSPYLETAYYNGWVEGYQDGTFKPENPVQTSKR